MATTDARSGFRLPWSSDRPTETETDASAETSTAQSSWSDTNAAATATDAAEAAPSAEAPAAPADSATGDDTGHAPDPEQAETTEPTPAPAWTAPVDEAPKPAGRKPNKFLADLTKAMQAAAEDARSRSSAQLQSDAKTHVETIHGRASTEAASLRRQADDDVAGIREWSKAEIARIREETEQRITDRKAQLESEIENHAAVIEREIDAVQRMVSSFEDEMTAFFERLLVEEDPTRFATMAENLPEPPSFDDISAVVGLHVETPAGDRDGADAAVTDSVVTPDQADPASDSTDAVAQAVVSEPAETDETVSAQERLDVVDASAADGDAVAEAATDDAAEAASEPEAVADDSSGWVEEADSDATVRADTDGEIDQEAAFAAIQAAAEAAASAEVASDAAASTEAVADVAIEIMGTHDEDTPEADPRVAALGLSPDYEAAEAEALADADAQQADGEEIPTIGDDALAARLAGLVPAGDASVSDDVAATQVVVVGLVSVASIASFKRHLGRVAGVQSVGVSSGPDGEFVFAVTHAPDANLRDAIPSLPSFQARVTSAVDGAIHVTAHDPEAGG